MLHCRVNEVRRGVWQQRRSPSCTDICGFVFPFASLPLGFDCLPSAREQPKCERRGSVCGMERSGFSRETHVHPQARRAFAAEWDPGRRLHLGWALVASCGSKGSGTPKPRGCTTTGRRKRNGQELEPAPGPWDESRKTQVDGSGGEDGGWVLYLPICFNL